MGCINPTQANKRWESEDPISLGGHIGFKSVSVLAEEGLGDCSIKE